MRKWPRFSRTGPAVTVGDVNAFEKQFGISLPEDYYDFLIDVNGGRTARESCDFGRGVVNSLFMLNADEEHQFADLVAWNERVTRDLGTNEVIVAGVDDGGGRTFFLSPARIAERYGCSSTMSVPVGPTHALCGTTAGT